MKKVPHNSQGRNKMTCSNNNNTSALINHFSLSEKIIMRTAFYGILIIGWYTIYIQHLVWSLFYTLFSLIGLFLLSQQFFCAYCPYPYQYTTCLFFPIQVFKLRHTQRQGRMNSLDKTGAVIIMVGLIMIPQFWLIKHLILFILFWFFCLFILFRTSLYYCKRCRYVKCPLSRISIDQKKAILKDL